MRTLFENYTEKRHRWQAPHARPWPRVVDTVCPPMSHLDRPTSNYCC
nr:MAG TPA: hypothetical protein [Caudoviricetes sp.]